MQIVGGVLEKMFDLDPHEMEEEAIGLRLWTLVKHLKVFPV